MRVTVTGGAGFIGSHLVDRLLDAGHDVLCYDNVATGHMRFIEQASTSRRFSFVEGDTLDQAALAQALRGTDLVFHLAANADVRHGTDHPRKDLEQNTIATFNVLEAMRGAGVRRIAFASTGSVYGEPAIFLDCSRIRALGWRPRLTIREGVVKTVDYLMANTWLFDQRS
jgi:UDP-glucose 4-epimerase